MSWAKKKQLEDLDRKIKELQAIAGKLSQVNYRK